MNLEGREFVDSITEVKIGKSPYPGINIELEPQNPSYPEARFQITATGGKIYPERFEVPFSARINYKDGSYEYYIDEFSVYPLKALVADHPADPVITESPFKTTVTSTATTTVTAEPETTTVTAPPVTTTVSAQPVTTTITAEPVTTTVTAEPETSTVTAPPETTTVTAPPVTTTATKVEEADSSTGGIIGIVIGILAALGIGAGSVFFAFENGLL